MRIATVITPFSDYNLQLVSQCGVTEVVTRYPGPEPGALAKVCEQAARFGVKVTVVEGYLPIDGLITGDERRESDLAAMKAFFREMDACDVRLASYHFMAGTDWVRTRLDAPERGGALTTAFNLADVDRARSLTDEAVAVEVHAISPETLWANLEYFLRELTPVAEECGIVLVMHPDDPPLLEFQGRARIMNCVESFERLVALVPSPSNKINFCQGTFAEMGPKLGMDIPAAIRRLGEHIRYVHFRDVRGTADNFAETFHDNGPTDMAAAMRAYRDIGFTGPMRPDHVPQLVGEEDGPPGYTMLGRLFAFGYMRGLMHAIDTEE